MLVLDGVLGGEECASLGVVFVRGTSSISDEDGSWERESSCMHASACSSAIVWFWSESEIRYPWSGTAANL